MTLPPVPKALGSLRHVFLSGLHSVLGERSKLGFAPKRKVLVILVDGLGAENILARAGHAPFLASQVSSGATSLAAYPVTTSSNITSFATGLTPGEHGIVGHVVRDSYFNHSMNLLNGWTTKTDPELWQPHKTVSEMANQKGVVCNVIAAEEYRSTGFTKATMREARFHGVDSIENRFKKAAELLATEEDSISYLYVSELDKYGHKHGWQSPGWAMLLEEFASEIDRFIKKIPRDAGVIITSDHGMMDSPLEQHIELKPLLSEFDLELFGGDTRSSYLYLSDSSAASHIKSKFQGSSVLTAVSPDDLVRANWYGPLGSEAKHRMPDLVLLAKGSHTLFHEDYSKPSSYQMIAHHGTPTPQELRIPLIRIGI